MKLEKKIEDNTQKEQIAKILRDPVAITKPEAETKIEDIVKNVTKTKEAKKAEKKVEKIIK